MDSDKVGWFPLPRFAPASRGLRCAPTALTDPSRGGKGSGRRSDAPLSTLRSVQGLHRDEIPCDDLESGGGGPIWKQCQRTDQFRFPMHPGLKLTRYLKDLPRIVVGYA